ncbi:MAG: hypothetical protein ACRDPH_12350 [Marmoricola sp.]
MKVRLLAVLGILICAVQMVRAEADAADSAPPPHSHVQQVDQARTTGAHR